MRLRSPSTRQSYGLCRRTKAIGGCSNSDLSKQDKGTFRAALELSSAGSAIILFLPLLASKHREGISTRQRRRPTANSCRPPRPHQTCWLIVPPGLRLAAPSVMKQPLDADRFTVLAFPAPDPTRSVVVLPGQWAAAALDTKRPVPALLFTLRPMRASLGLSTDERSGRFSDGSWS